VAIISPFRGLRYDPATVGDLASVTAPPYDVISAEALERFEAMSPYNIVRLILSRATATKDKYTQAAETLERWISDGVLVRDERDSITVYEQRFTLAGRERVQRGLLAAVSLEDEGASVLPHEHTMAAPVSDRLALLRATRAQLSPVFVVYTSEDGGARDVVSRTVETPPLAEWHSDDDDVTHLTWRLDDAAGIGAVARTIERATVVIADGHHRFRTALEYRAERRAQDGAGPWDQMLLFLVDSDWSGPALLPIHRLIDVAPDDVLAAVAGAFDVEESGTTDPEALAAELADRRAHGRAFALLGRGRAWWLTVADKAAEAEAMPGDRTEVWRDLDVAVLEWFVMRRLLGGAEARYVHTATEAAEAIARDEAASVLLLAPMPFDAVRAVAEARESMPPKSTFFVPKARSGVVIRPLF
jgi:uncharacterized protein (DUF1015 family)